MILLNLGGQGRQLYLNQRGFGDHGRSCPRVIAPCWGWTAGVNFE
ncbi:MAG: hypothetical protein ACOYMW_11185 [Candidatus Competibacteraceae bacterium]